MTLDNELIFKLLEEKCKNFDWCYARSDDHKVWKKGNDAESELKQLIKICEDVNFSRTKNIVLKYQSQYGVKFYKDDNI